MEKSNFLPVELQKTSIANSFHSSLSSITDLSSFADFKASTFSYIKDNDEISIRYIEKLIASMARKYFLEQTHQP